MTVVPAVATPRVASRLAGVLRPADVLHRGRDAVYLDLDGWCLGVVREPAVRVPCAVVIAGGSELDLAEVRTATAGDSELVLDGQPIRVARFRDARVAAIRERPDRSAVATLMRHASPAREELGEIDDPHDLVGRGSGLTPLGDDVLAGWTSTSYALGEPTKVPDARDRTTLLSATLLDCAARGEVLPEFADVVAALPDPASTDRAAARLARVGHTSGAGLLLGAALRLEQGLAA